MINNKYSLEELNNDLDLSNLEKDNKILEIDQDIKVSIITLECREPDGSFFINKNKKG